MGSEMCIRDRSNRSSDRSSISMQMILPRRAGIFLICTNLAHVAGWESHNLRFLGHVSWGGSVLYRSCTSHTKIVTAGYDLDDLLDLSDLSHLANI